MSESLSMKAFLLLGILLAGAAAATGAGNLIFLAGDWEDGAGTVQRLYGLLVMLAAGSVIVGLLLSRPRPTLGVRLVLLGCVGTIVLWFWVFMITIPVSIGLILLARKRAYGEALPWKKQTPRLA